MDVELEKVMDEVSAVLAMYPEIAGDRQLRSLTLKVFAFVDRHPDDGKARLEMFLADDTVLLDTTEVARLTGWSDEHINRLCRDGLLTYIPGKPYKFLPSTLMGDLRNLQVGGQYGRKRSRTLNGLKVSRKKKDAVKK